VSGSDMESMADTTHDARRTAHDALCTSARLHGIAANPQRQAHRRLASECVWPARISIWRE
jgi:hypothetical protein